MKLELYNNNILKDIFETINMIVDEIGIECDNEGIRLQAIDRSHITFVSLDLKSSLFDEYTCETPEKICLDTGELMKVLKRCKNNDLLKWESDISNLHLTFEGDSTREFNIRLIDLEYESPQPPELNPPVTLKLPVETLNDFLGDIELFGETIQFTVDENYFTASGDGDFGDSTVKYLHGEHVREVVVSRFNIARIKDMLRAKKLNKEINLKLGTDMPLILEYDINIGEGLLSFLLAPRLDIEE